MDGVICGCLTVLLRHLRGNPLLPLTRAQVAVGLELVEDRLEGLHIRIASPAPLEDAPRRDPALAPGGELEAELTGCAL